MTREEARQGLQGYSLFIADGTELKEALNMAIEALSSDTISREDTVTLNSPISIQAEMVAVVRCKDCKWYDNRYGDVCHNPRYGDGHANYQPPYVDEDYWCKDGKGGDDE
jgi:hypothetical protein